MLVGRKTKGSAAGVIQDKAAGPKGIHITCPITIHHCSTTMDINIASQPPWSQYHH